MKQISRIGWGIAVLLPLVFLVVFFCWPVCAMLMRGIFGSLTALPVEAPSTNFFHGLFTLLSETATWKIIWQTLWMALAGTFLSLLCGIPSAYTLYCLDFCGKKILRALITMPFVLPAIVVGIAFSAVFRGPLAFLGLENSPLAVVFAMAFFNFAVVVRTVGIFWQNLDERMNQAAQTLGASPLRAFCTVTLPQLGPAIAAAASIVFLYCATAYGIVTTLGNPGYGTLETQIYRETVVFFHLDKAAMLSVLQFIIVVGAIFCTSHFTARTEQSLKIKARARRKISRVDWVALAITGGVLCFILLPLITLLLRSLQVAGEWSFANYLSLRSPGTGFAAGTSAIEALSHSVKIASDATLITCAIGVPLAFVLSRRSHGVFAQAQRLLDGFILLPLGISTVTVGFGFLLVFGGTRIGASPLLVPLAQAVVALPIFVRVLVPSLRAIDPRMRQAARTLGANSWQVLRTIDFPYLLRGLGLALGFSFAISFGEFGATSFLANPDYLTLPVVIVKLLGRPGADNYGMALAAAVILALITAVAMIFGELVSVRKMTFRAKCRREKGRQRVQQMLDQAVRGEVAHSKAVHGVAVQLREISVTYPGGFTAINGLNLMLQPGEIVALLGASGSGKSTLLRAIAGLEPLAQGQIFFNDIDVSHLPPHRRKVGMVFQDAQLFPHRNVYRNVVYALEIAKMPRVQRQKRVAQLLELVGLSGYEQRAVDTLSGGQAQRIALARSLAGDPQVLLLDEPLSALDASLRSELGQQLRSILQQAGTTALLVTHDLAEAKLIADRIVDIADLMRTQNTTGGHCLASRDSL